jgi:hypothetical protein
LREQSSTIVLLRQNRSSLNSEQRSKLAFVSFTVVPVHNLDLGVGCRIPFGSKTILQDVPEWLKEDKHILTDIGRIDRNLTLAARHALVSEYNADSLGFLDPE